MARAHSVWIIIRNGKPAASFTVKHEAQAWLVSNKGWNIDQVWKLPDGRYPMFLPKQIPTMEFMAE